MHARPLLRAVAAALVLSLSCVSHVVTIGLSVPEGSPLECMQASEYITAAGLAASALAEHPLWSSSLSSTWNVSVGISVLPQSSAGNGWSGLEAFVAATDASALPCSSLSPSELARLQLPLNSLSSSGFCVLESFGLIDIAEDDVLFALRLLSFSRTFPAMYLSSTPHLSASAEHALNINTPFYRFLPSDVSTAAAMASWIIGIEWTKCIIVASPQYQTLQDLLASALAAAEVEVNSRFTFQSRDAAHMKSVLQSMSGQSSRVVVLLADAVDAAVMLQLAKEGGMAGKKGWAYVGNDWVRDRTWQTAPPAAAFYGDVSTVDASALQPTAASIAATRAAMSGVVGFSPAIDEITPSAPAGAVQMKQGYNADTVSAASRFVIGANASRCSPYVFTEMKPFSDTSFAIFSAVWQLGMAAALKLNTSLSSSGIGSGLPIHARNVSAVLRFTQSNNVADALEGIPDGDMQAVRAAWRDVMTPPTAASAPSFFPSGDRVDLPIAIYNIYGSQERIVAYYDIQAPSTIESNGKTYAWCEPLCIQAQISEALGRGEWRGGMGFSSITWPSGLSDVPIDEVLEGESYVSVILVINLFGIAVSLLAGSLVHKYHLASMLPESGATLIIGIIVGLILLLVNQEQVTAAANFQSDVFMLVILPIIIFESGYALEKKPFFTQLWSIATFAIAGTIISAAIIGSIVAAASQAGYVIPLSVEESLAFASLLSATDPVATLSVFNSLQVEPSLQALVYGEAALNDAVALVLYRTLTRFMVETAETTSQLEAVGAFVGVMFGSVFLGLAVAMVATLCLRALVNFCHLEGYVIVEAGNLETSLSTRHASLGYQFCLWYSRIGCCCGRRQRGFTEGGEGASPLPSPPISSSNGTKSAPAPARSRHKMLTPPKSRRLEHLRAKAREAKDSVGIALQTIHAPPAPPAPAAAPLGKDLPERASENVLRDITGIAEESESDTEVSSSPAAATAKDFSSVGLTLTQTLPISAMGSAFVQGSVVLLFGYISYSLAEVCGMSGIVCALFAGIGMHHYCRLLMDAPGKWITTGVLRMLASLADTSVFFQVGINIVLLAHQGHFDVVLVALSIIGCIVGRFLHVFLLSTILNTRRKHKISWQFMIQIWHAGLRGGLAFVPCLSFPSQHRQYLVNAVSMVVLFSIITEGTTTERVLRSLKIPYGVRNAVGKHAIAQHQEAKADRVKAFLVWTDEIIQRLICGDRAVDRDIDAYEALANLERRKHSFTVPANSTIDVVAHGNSTSQIFFEPYTREDMMEPPQPKKVESPKKSVHSTPKHNTLNPLSEPEALGIGHVSEASAAGVAAELPTQVTFEHGTTDQ